MKAYHRKPRQRQPETDAGPAGENLSLRIHGNPALPTLIYLPGLHGDWTIIGGFGRALASWARFVEFTYPRTLDWSLDDYAATLKPRWSKTASPPAGCWANPTVRKSRGHWSPAGNFRRKAWCSPVDL